MKLYLYYTNTERTQITSDILVKLTQKSNGPIILKTVIRLHYLITKNMKLQL